MREILSHDAQGKSFLSNLDDPSQNFDEVPALVRILTNELKNFHETW